MFYIYNKNTLQFNKVKWMSGSLKVLVGLVLLSLIIGWNSKSSIKENYTESEVKIIMSKYNQFDKEKLITLIKELHFKFPYIIYAQSLLETHNFTSKIFLENNNLFGMKEATKRINTAKGTQYEHAFYNHWIDSVMDYAFYNSTYLFNIDNESDYFTYLGQYYAEDKEYVKKLKCIIKEEKLKELFNN